MPALLPGLEHAAAVNAVLVNSKGEKIDVYTMMVDDRIKLQRKVPFWAIVLQSMLSVEVPYNHPLVSTCATDGARIYYNPLFMHLIGEQARIFVLAHEVCHVIFDTFTRCGDRDRQIWNYASDYVINQVLVESGLTMPKQQEINDALEAMRKMGLASIDEIEAYVGKFDLNKPEKVVGLQDNKYRGMTQEQVYELLVQEAEKKIQQSGGKKKIKIKIGGQPGQSGQPGQGSQGQKGQQPGGQGGQGQGQPGDGEEEIEINISLGDALGLGTLDSHIMDELMSDEDFVETAQRIRGAVEAAMAQGRGTVPGAIASLIEAANKPRVGWRSLLQAEAMDRRPEDYSWERPDPVLMTLGITMPSISYEDELRVCLVVDTSGSMSDEDLGKVFTEIHSIVRQFTSFKLDILQCDAAIQGEPISFDPDNVHELSDFRFSGRGGTYYRPAMEWVAERRDQYDWMVFFTDGGGEGWNEDMQPLLPPLVWLIIENCTTPQEPPNWGRVIMYDKYG